MKEQPLCRYCGGKIRKHTTSVFIKDRPRNEHDHDTSYSRTINVEKLPQTIGDCRKLTNKIVTSVHRHKAGSYDDSGTWTHTDTGIDRFEEWDGDSYADKFFCNGDHAKRFAYAVLKTPKYEGIAMPDYLIALEKRKKKEAA